MPLYQGPFFPFYSLSLLISFSVIVVSHGRVLTVMHYIIAGLCGREYGECEPLLCDLCDAKWSELWVNDNKQRNPKQSEREYRFLVLEWRVLEPYKVTIERFLYLLLPSDLLTSLTIHFCSKSLNSGQQNIRSARLWWLRLDGMKDGGWGFQTCSYNIACFFHTAWPFFCWDCDFPSISVKACNSVSMMLCV